MGYYDYVKAEQRKTSEIDAIVMDDVVNLTEHDAQRHHGHFDPKTMSCKLRDELGINDKTDRLDANAGNSLVERAANMVGKLVPGLTIKFGDVEDSDRSIDLYDSDRMKVGVFDPESASVTLSNDADVGTVLHEVLGHAVAEWARQNNKEMYGKLMQYAAQAPENIKEYVAENYGGSDADTIAEELLAHRIDADLKDAFMEVLQDEDKPWYEKAYDCVKGIWNGALEKLGIKNGESNDYDSMSPEEVVKSVFGMAMSGKSLGGILKPHPKEMTPEESVGALLDDENGDTVDVGGKRYSIKSMRRDIAEGKMMSDLVNEGIMTQEEADAFEKNIVDLVGKMSQNAFILDMNETDEKEDRPFTPFKPNSDPLYKVSLDFSTLCKKRLLTQRVIEGLQLKQKRMLSAEEQLAIRDMLLDYQKIDEGLQVACHLCYVEAARLKSPKQVNQFLADRETPLKVYFAKRNKQFAAEVARKQGEYKSSLGLPPDCTKKEMKDAKGDKAVKELNRLSDKWRKDYTPTEEESAIIEKAKGLDASTFLSADNLAKLRISDPEIFEAYSETIRNATRSKGLEANVAYYYGDSRGVSNKKGELISKGLTDDFIEKSNNQGTGLRHQSWSDFTMTHLLDTITAVCDLSVRKAKMHAYTKVPAFVECFGNTGIMMNLSLIPNLDGNGFSSTEGMEFNEAKRLRDKYPDTAGTISIAMSDENLAHLLNDNSIDYIIPYHTSGMNKGLRKIAGIEGWKNYSDYQHEQKISGAKKPDGMDKKLWQKEPEQSEWLVDGDDGYEAMRKSAQKYISLCAERGLKPKFEDVKVNGKSVTQDPNYWKLLIDHKMVNHKTGKLIKQQTLKPNFDFDEINRQVDAEVTGFNRERMDNAYNYVLERVAEIPKRAAQLKRVGAYKKLMSQMPGHARDGAEELRKYLVS